MEIVTEIVFIAARLALQEDWDEGSSSSPSSSALRLASVNTLAYDAIVGNLLLRDLILTGVEQVEAFAASLRRNRRLARLAAVGGKVKTLAVVQATPGGVGGRGRRRRRRDEGEALGEQEPRRDSLYDVRLRDKTFAKGILVPLRSFILPLTARSLQKLHIESLPTALLPPTGAARLANSGGRGNLSLVAASRSIEEVTLTLSPWGGASVREIFIAPAPAPTPAPPHAMPWSHLYSIQIHGSEGFRFCLPSAIALSSLPALKRLALVMPSSSAGGLEEALRLLVALTAGRLETLLVVGHDMENWAGWAGPYGMALRSLRKPARGEDRQVESELAATRAPLRIKHVTARLQRRPPALPSMDEGQQQQQVAVAPTVQHPSYYRSWIVARTTEQTQWDWSSGEGGAAESPSAADGKEQAEGTWTCHRSRSLSSSITADEAFGVEWRCDEWDVPAEVEDEDGGERATEEAEYGVGRQATAGNERREVFAAA